MKRWLQRLRGAIGTAVTWAVGWFGAGILLYTTGWFGQPTLLEYALFSSAVAGLGFIGGIGFSVVLSLTEGRRRFDQMSIPRFAMWGALGGAIMLLALGEGPGLTLAFFALLGAGSAAGSLALARRTDDRELLSDGIAEVGHSRAETRELLGE